VDFPLGVFACISGVSGSGKSTLVHEVLFKNLQAAKGLPTEDGVGRCRAVLGHEAVDQVVMVDQSPLSRTPRSSPAVYLGVFDAIRELFACTPDALARGLTASAFSFNSGTGRCERCSGSGFEKIEMQFLSDVFVRCPECDGKRYQPELLELLLGGEPGVGKSIHDVLSMTVSEAIGFFTRLGAVKVVGPLSVLEEVGLGYLTLGQPLNVLSGGESQRLKLVERLTRRGEGPALLIFDEPTTGLHFDDVALLIRALNRLVDAGHSLLVIEHNLEVIKCADYLVDLGPDAGVRGGEVVAVGTPEEVAQNEESHTGRFLRPLLLGVASDKAAAGLRAAEQPAVPVSGRRDRDNAIQIFGAREHNLKNFNLRIPRNEMVIITGLSGSGKSTLAFDLLFAEGQRRFLDSMSAYARQFVEQLEKPEVDLITGLPPSVAIEQRITRGGGKSTVATVTEVYHFLRLLFAKLGVQYCPRCDLPVQKQGLSAIVRQAEALARKGPLRVLAPLVKARKGFHTDVAKWAVRHGFKELLVDGFWVRADRFEKLERFQEHTIEVLIGISGEEEPVGPLVQRALEVGKGTARILEARSARATARAVTSGEGVVVSLDRSCPGCGESFEELDPRLFSFNSPHGWCVQCHGFGEVWKATVNPRLETAVELELDEERQHEALEDGEAEPCPGCRGTRLNEGARAVRLGGHTLPEITAWSAGQAQAWVSNLKFTGAQAPVAADILPEIRQRLQFMGEVGLDYLTLARSAKTLSGGESQRIRLAAQLGSNLQGVLYVLDEPTIGLHPRDNEQLLDTLEALKAKGNSLIIVEHDEETMRRADSIIDLGPGAGSRGGQVVAHGTLAQILENPGSATGRCLREPLQHPTRGSRRALNEVSHWLEVQNACLNNLKDVRVRLPLGRLNVITGISGSGKSTLMRGVLKPAVDACLKKGGVPAAGKRKPSKPRGRTLPWGKVTGAEHIEAVYEVDQSPIGKTSRSTPATYIKVFDEIRKLYAQVPLARMRGYSASRFSFNSEGGRCETCAGQGMIKIEMNFLPTSYAPCHECGGRRYHSATLEVLYNERSIGDVMEMTLDQAVEFFKASPKIQRPLALLCDTGLGYLKLGQPSPTLSGGEAQRLKLASELTRGLGRTQNARLRGKGAAKSMLYLLEEPTIGLHMADVCELLKVLHRLVDDGQTVVVIEHNLSLIAEADYLLDVGPEAGAEGGRIVAEGTPEQVAQSAESRTAPFLRETLQLPDPGRKRSRGLRAE
jgi:excinuclease ABC subunit A